MTAWQLHICAVSIICTQSLKFDLNNTIHRNNNNKYITQDFNAAAGSLKVFYNEIVFCNIALRVQSYHSFRAVGTRGGGTVIWIVE